MTDSIQVSITKGVYRGGFHKMRLRARYGLVYWMIDDKILELRTPAAHRVGFEMVKKAGLLQKGELVTTKINGTEIQYSAYNAKQVGGALLRKADDADDFQLQRIKR